MFYTFLKDIRRKRTADVTTSSDGTYSVNNKAKSRAKKPCQKKRPTTERARTRRWTLNNCFFYVNINVFCYVKMENN